MPKMYEQFKTDDQFERDGVFLDYDNFRVKVARAGGANKNYTRQLEMRTKPYRRAIQTDTFTNDMARKILLEVYIGTVIREWEVHDEETGEWVRGIHSPEGEVLPVTKDNIKKALEDLPDLFDDIQDGATKVSLFKETILEEEAGNL